jgi:hypothetical protein
MFDKLPIRFRVFTADNFFSAELALVTRPNGGLAKRETAVRVGFRSDHLVQLAGIDNPADTFECPDTGTLFIGKIVNTPDGVLAVTSRELYTEALIARAAKDAVEAVRTVKAKAAAVADTAPTEPAKVTVSSDTSTKATAKARK